MRVVVVAHGKLTIPYFTPHDVVLHITLAIAPSKHAVFVLPEAHHHTAHIDGVEVIDGIGKHVPANFTLGVDDGVDRFKVPFQCTAHRIVPDNTGTVGVLFTEVIDQIQTIGKFRIHFDHTGLKEVAHLHLAGS